MTLTIAALAVLAALGAIATYAVVEYRRYRGARAITCPETKAYAVVQVDAAHAALSSPWTDAHVRLRTCTRWPEREGCGQECLCQVMTAPDGCRVTDALDRWYAGRACALCGIDLTPAVTPRRPPCA